jgi:uncharacterized repeat protein (TIGR01451 family)
MKKLSFVTRLVGWLLLGALLITAGDAPQAASQLPWQDKVEPSVLTQATRGETEFIIFLAKQADLSGAAALQTKQEKGQYVYERLREVAGRTQKPLLETLEARGVEFRPYWIANMIWVRGGMDLIQQMALRKDVRHIYANPPVKLDLPVEQSPALEPEWPEGIQWNLLRVNADDVWARGYTGQGVVIGGQDTGYEWDHPALKEHYRGWDGVTADHNYNWHDAIHSEYGNPCGSNTVEPCDDYGHGTHTMGILVGLDPAQEHHIGMAPGAKWIGCRNMDEGFGTPISYSECYQWFLAPTDLNDQNPDVGRAPDIINNSWGCSPDEGCTEPDILLAVVEAVRSAGIMTVHSAGNDGPDCYTIDMPAAIYDASFTVGSTTSFDTMSSSSSRGPVALDGSWRMKPDVSAPGSWIYSSIPGGYYGGMSGTSMAAPHVAGLAALLVSAQPALRGRVDDLEALITRTAVRVHEIDDGCGGMSGTEFPNNVAGWGRIDALRAVVGHVLHLSKTTPDTRVMPGDLITYTLVVDHLAATDATHQVVLEDAIPQNTSFVGATGPYFFDGTAVHWEFPSLAPLERVEVQLTVQVQADFVGEIRNDHYQVSSAEVVVPVAGDPVITQVISPYGVSLGPDHTEVITPGESLVYVYEHTLTNTGIVTDTFDLDFNSSLGWASFTSSEVTLDAGQSVDLVIYVSVPGDTPRGFVDTTMLIATSRSSPNVTAIATDVTAVGAPYYAPMTLRNVP